MAVKIKNNYESPVCKELAFSSEGVLCVSTNASLPSIGGDIEFEWEEEW